MEKVERVPPIDALPQELIDTIIDYLHDDQTTLNACSRVSRHWLQPSRFHFFSRICLKATSPQVGNTVPQNRCSRLHAVLTRCEYIIPYIRELEICEGSPLHHYAEGQSSTTWVTTERSLASLFRMLKSVQRFDFSSTSIFHWTLLPPTFQASLCHLLSLPTLRYVRLHSWKFPNLTSLMSMLFHCRNLRAFSLSSTTIGDHGSELVQTGVPDDLTRSPATPLNLEALTLDHVAFPCFDRWFLSSDGYIDITSLRELRVAHFDDGPHIIDKLLLAVGGSLEHFHFKPGNWPVHSFNLSLNSGLRSIRLTLDVLDYAMEWAIKLLSVVKENHLSVENVGLEFWADPKKIEHWAPLDSLLVSFESLKQVEIGLFAIPTTAEFLAVKDKMSGLQSRGIARWYQLGLKNRRSGRQLMPRIISRYES